MNKEGWKLTLRLAAIWLIMEWGVLTNAELLMSTITLVKLLILYVCVCAQVHMWACVVWEVENVIKPSAPPILKAIQ